MQRIHRWRSVLPDRVTTHIEALMRSVSALTRERGGVLVALTVSVPAKVAPDVFKEALVRRLADSRLAPVDVSTVVGNGAARIISAEFEVDS